MSIRNSKNNNYFKLLSNVSNKKSFFRAFILIISLNFMQSCEFVVRKFQTDYATTEKKVQKFLKDSFKKNKDIPDSVIPSFDLKTTSFDKSYNLELNYSYKFNSNNLDRELKNFNNGEYLIEASAVGDEFLNAVKTTLNTYFKDEIEIGSKMHFQLYGNSDAAKFRLNSTKRYKGEFGEFPSEDKTSRFTFKGTNRTRKVFLKKGDKLDNEKLSFLRAYNMEQYIKSEILRGEISWRQYDIQILVGQEQNRIGGEFRSIRFVLTLTKIPYLHN